MLDNIKDSIKAKLYDFAYTPFMSSYIISWVLFNHKFLLVYFGESPLDDKLLYLGECHLESLLPLYVALIYVFVYPLFALGFYAATLWYKKLSKDVKTKIEKITPIHTDEAKKIREDIVRLEDEKDEALKKLGKKEDEYKEKLENELQPLQEKIGSLEMQLMSAEQQAKKLREDNNSLEGQLNHMNKMMELKIEECEELKAKVADLEKQLASVGVVNATVQIDGVQTGQTSVSNQASDDFSKVVKYLHDSYKNMMEEDLVAKLMSADIGVASAVARKIINKLIEEKVLLRSHSGVISITPQGSSKLVELMDGIHA
jgi:hypothetical protein